MLKGISIPAQPFFNERGGLVGDRRDRYLEGRRLLDDVPDHPGCGHIPAELLQAARIDGASRFRQFVHVTLPMLKRVLLYLSWWRIRR